MGSQVIFSGILAAILLTSVDDEVLYLKIGDEQQQFALKMAARISNAIALRSCTTGSEIALIQLFESWTRVSMKPVIPLTVIDVKHRIVAEDS